jgi:hypothetical protein
VNVIRILRASPEKKRMRLYVFKLEFLMAFRPIAENYISLGEQDSNTAEPLSLSARESCIPSVSKAK